MILKIKTHPFKQIQQKLNNFFSDSPPSAITLAAEVRFV
jgi:hypothetical protein